MKQLNRRAGGGQFIEGWENKGGERSSKLNGHIFQIKSIDGPKLVIIRLASPSHNWGTKPLIASVPMDVSMTNKTTFSVIITYFMTGKTTPNLDLTQLSKT